jgi:hypothetical protein
MILFYFGSQEDDLRRDALFFKPECHLLEQEIIGFCG